MDNTLKKLTEQLYQEGIEKGNLEAGRIIDDARKMAENIKNEAEKEAEQLLQNTKKETQELIQSAHSEIKLAADQALNALKQTITDLINSDVIDKMAAQNLSEIQSLKDIILKLFENWNPGNENPEYTVLIPENIQKELESLISKEIKTQMEKGIALKSDKWQLDGFSIKANDDSYRINFSSESFAAFFKEFLRPKLNAILFKTAE